MNALTVVFAALCIFAIGYRFYGLFIANKVLNLNDARVTPAVKYSDGHDYVDTNKYVLFGHHFAAIAAAGPLLGPVLAAQFGYMPGLLWILIGCVLAGGVHDMVVLFASVRHRGQSLAYIASQEIDKTTGSVAAWAVLAILLLTLAGLRWRTARWERAALLLCFGWQLVLGLCASWSVPLLCAGLVVLALLLVYAAYGARTDGESLTAAPMCTGRRAGLVIAAAAAAVFLAAVLALWFFYTLIRVFTKRRSLLRWLAGVLLGVSAGLFAFVGLWGLNHFGPSVGQTLGLDVREYSKQELIAATAYYAAQANEYAARVDRDANGKTVYPAFSELAVQAPAGYAALAERYEQFTGALDPVKPLASWRLFSQTGTTGIFVCFTAEACVNPDTYTAWIPYTMCHELAHRQAVAAEDDANFCAYLACMASGSDDFCYSGAFGAYVYCHNALSKVDKTAASQIWTTLSDGVVTDLRAANEHYAQYEGKVQDAAQKVNDTYLKAFSEESGVQSYGEAADLLIAWYLENNA